MKAVPGPLPLAAFTLLTGLPLQAQKASHWNGPTRAHHWRAGTIFWTGAWNLLDAHWIASSLWREVWFIVIGSAASQQSAHTTASLGAFAAPIGGRAILAKEPTRRGLPRSAQQAIAGGAQPLRKTIAMKIEEIGGLPGAIMGRPALRTKRVG